MASCLLSASPSWYCTRVSDCSENGLFVFGAKNSLIFLDVSKSEPWIVGHLQVHQERVTGVSLCHTFQRDEKCVTTSDDCRVRVWDLKDRALLFEHAEHKGQPTAVHWSPVDEDLVVSGDDKGVVAIWKPAAKTLNLFTPENGHIFCLTCSPYNRFHLAVGYKAGSIIVADIGRNGTVLQKLRGHDEEIHCLCWSPAGDKKWEIHSADGSEFEPLLVSGSRDRTIKVWSGLTGRNISSLKLPTNTGYKRDRYEDQNRSRAWVTICWPPHCPRQFVTSSYNGDILWWDLDKAGKQKWELFSSVEVKGHNRIVFNIVSVPPNHNKICTISMDRQIVTWNLDTREAESKIATLGGFVYNMALSSLNPNRLAIGVGDNMIRVCNISGPDVVKDTISLWQGIKSKVTALSWHPIREGHLAYGTDDGRVGIYDVLSQKPPLVSHTFHKRTVYVVTWGPPCPSDSRAASTGYSLYSCGDGTVLQHDPQKLDRPAVDMNKVIGKQNNLQKCPSRTEVSFKPDLSSVAFGNEDGSVDIFTVPELVQLCSIKLHRKLVNTVRWHPGYLTLSEELSACRHWLAVGSNDLFVSVVDLKNVLESQEPTPADVRQVTESLCRLEGHSNRVTGLSWSSHNEGQLASASYDGTAQVWDVKNVKPVANYRGHSGRVFCVQWSMTDPDVIYTGGDDFSVRAFSVSKQEHSVPPKGREFTKKKKGKQKTKDTTVESQEKAAQNAAVATASDVQMLQDLLAAKKRALELETSSREDQQALEMPLENERAAQENVVDEEETCPGSDSQGAGRSDSSMPEPSRPQPKMDAPRKVHDGASKRKRKDKSLFPVFNKMETRGKLQVQGDTMDLASILYKGQETRGNKVLTEDQTHLGFFTDRPGAFQHLSKEESHHTEHSNNEQVALLRLWKGDFGDVLRDAAAKRELNDWLVAMAPMASPRLWREMCVAFAKQLEDSGFFHRAASYLLAVHKVQEAVEMLVRHGLFRDAVSLAKSRLMSEDPVLIDVYSAWAEQLLQENSFEQAAQCYLAIRKPNEAAAALARRVDSHSLKAAMHISLVAEEMVSFKNYAVRFIQACQISGDWVSTAEVLSWHKSLKSLALYTVTHEFLCQEMDKLATGTERLVEEPKYSASDETKRTDPKIPRLLLNPALTDPLSPWKPVTRDGQPLIHQILSYWCQEYESSLSNETLVQYVKELTQLVQMKQDSVALAQVVQSVALYVSLGILCLLLCDTEETAHWWSVALSKCNDAQHKDLLPVICQLLLPQGPGHLIELQQQVTAIRHSTSQDAEGTRPAALTNFSLRSRDRKDGVENESAFCTSFDCLGAHYYHAVLVHYTAKSAQQTDNGGVQKQDIDDSSIKRSDQLHSGDGTESEECASMSDKPADLRPLSSKQAQELAQRLLWNTQIKKLALEEALVYINRATIALINQYQDVQEDSTGGESEKHKVRGSVMLTPPSICRTVSGEYLHMKPGHALFIKSPFASPAERAEHETRDRCDSGGYEVMMPCIDEDAVASDQINPRPTENITLQDKLSLSSPLARSAHEPDAASNFFVPETEEREGRVDVSRREPVDLQYKSHNITVTKLSQEQQRVTAELHDVMCKMKSTPFPHPLESAKLLIQMLPGSPENSETHEAIRQWGLENAFLSEQQIFFSAQTFEGNGS